VATGTDGTDAGGWQAYGSDWTFFFDCMFAPVVTQAATAISRLDIAVATGSKGAPQLLLLLKNALAGAKSPTVGKRPVAMILPRHGPVIRQGLAQLVSEYSKCVLAVVTASGACGL
jgi:hypothetical protein